MSTLQTLEQVQERKLKILQGDPSGLQQQTQAGKQPARQRIEMLLDDGSFVELGQLVAQDGQSAGVVTGYGTMDERPVCIFAQDFTVRGGAMNQAQAEKITRLLDMAKKTGSPVLALMDSAGARVDEGAGAVEAYARVGAALAGLSGVVPTVALVLGPCLGGAALLAQLMDFTFMAQGIGQRMSHGPQVIASTFEQSWTADEIGGAAAMMERGGADFVSADEAGCFAQVRRLLSMLPSNNLEDAPVELADDMTRLLPAFTAGTAAKEVIAALVDAGTFLEVGEGYTDRVGGFARLGGQVVLVSATGGGALCARGAKKLARLVRFADCYNIPILSLIDTEGLAVMKPEHQPLMLKAAAQLLYAYGEATCAKLSLVTGSAIGAGYVAMGGQAGSDLRYAWPGTVISPLSPEAAVQVLESDKIAASTGDAPKAREALAGEYAAGVADGVMAAQAGLIDDVINPVDSRKLLIAGLQMIGAKRDSNPPKKHGNLPL